MMPFIRTSLCRAVLRLVCCAALFAGLASASAVSAQSESVRIDASQPAAAPAAARYALDFASAPGGHALGLNSRYLTRDGQPWLPVMAEMHYSRVPRDRWDDALAQLKASGVDIVAAYVIWIHHEEVQGQFDWSGQRDLRAFAQLCQKHGLLLEPRIGPWAHAEVRNGGLPDWVVQQGPTRQNDPKYLASVDRFFRAIGVQLHGLMWQDGGPVVAIQLENEYAARGPGRGAEHIRTLKQMAIAAGLQAPYYFVTGWDNAVVPAPDVMPVYGGGYPDAPWDDSTARLAPPEVYAFRFSSRVASNMGAIGDHGAALSNHTAQTDGTPYMTAEIGGGNEGTYHRRPVIHPGDIAAMVPVMLGSGVNLYGTYMFRGGTNPDGRLTTLQESQATGYINDLPLKSYDFQAPIGEFGDERLSLRQIKLYQYFLNSFGPQLAPMAVYAPAVQPASPADLAPLRVSVRVSGRSGFLFCNNHVRNYPTPAHPSVQFEVNLPGGVLRFPAQPVAVPSGAYFIWPFEQQLGAAHLRYATAQLVTRLDAAQPIYVFAAVRGIAPEFAFSAASAVRASSGAVATENGITLVRSLKADQDTWIDVTAPGGSTTRILVLSADDADNAWRVHLAGADRLLVTPADVVPTADGVELRSRGSARFSFRLLPAPAQPPAASAPLTPSGPGFTASLPERDPIATLTLVQAPGLAPPVPLGPLNGRKTPVAQAPSEAPLPAAGRWSIVVPPHAADGLSELYLDIRYTGDVARIAAAGRLLDDDYFSGQPWRLGLLHLFAGQPIPPLQLSVLPLRADAPVYLELDHPLAFDAHGQAARVESLRLVPEYRLTLASASR